MRNLIHQVDVMEPPTATDDRGQEAGIDLVYLAKVPCSIEPINTRELEAARQIYSLATHRVQFYGSPKQPITHRHWLRQKMVSDPTKFRRLEIGSAVDTKQNGTEWDCLCSEVVA